MDYVTALNLLGVPEGATPREVEIAYRQKWEELQKWGREAPTEALRTQCWQTLEQLTRAREVLLHPDAEDETEFRPPSAPPSSDSWLEDWEANRTQQRSSDPTIPVPTGSGSYKPPPAQAKLRVEENGRLIKNLVLGASFTVGRSEDNTLALDHMQFSRHHFRFDPQDGGHVLVDLGSLNGTMVNNQPVVRHLLCDGDVVQVGPIAMTYLAPQGPSERQVSGRVTVPNGGSKRLIAFLIVLLLALVGLFSVRHKVKAWLASGSGDSTDIAGNGETRELRVEIAELNVEDRDLVNVKVLEVQGRLQVYGGRLDQIRVGDQVVPVQADGSFAASVALDEGENSLLIDTGHGHHALSIIVDVVEPHVRASVQDDVVSVKSNEILRSLQVGNAPLREVEGMIHRLPVVRLPIDQTLVVRAFDRAGNESGASVFLPALPVDREQRRTADSLGVPLCLRTELGMGLVLIPAGDVQSGSPEGEDGRFLNEHLRELTVSRAFYMKATEVSQAEYAAVMGESPAFFKSAGLDAAVESVSWYDAVRFCNRLSELEGLEPVYAISGQMPDAQDEVEALDVKLLGIERTGYRLPTEAEWELACRAGANEALFTGPMKILGALFAPELDEIAWYGGNARADYEGAVDSSTWEEKQYQHRHAGVKLVARKQPNRWGLFDTLGNVWEWCWDFESETPDGSLDPVGPADGTLRIVRGGSWIDSARDCRCARRRGNDPSARSSRIGFRPVRTVP